MLYDCYRYLLRLADRRAAREAAAPPGGVRGADSPSANLGAGESLTASKGDTADKT